MSLNNPQNDPTESSVPRDAIMMADLLRQCGVSKYEPHVINQLLEVAYRMARNTLVKADNIREHVGRPQISLQDLEYARKAENNAAALREQVQPELDKDLTFARNIQPFEPVPERIMLIPPPDARANSLAPTYDILLPPS